MSDPSQSVYSYVGGQIATLIPQFGLQPLRPQIMQTYEKICRESLAFYLGTRPADYSRINHDGTPFQYAVTLGSPLRSLLFLSEAGMPGLPGAERIRVNRDCIATVAKSLQADAALASVTNLLDELAPNTHADLLADPAGAFWTGVAFASGREPQLRIYTNARWGSERERWSRLRRFASYFGSLKLWQRLENTLAPDMKPLGTAVTLGGETPPTGRIYLTAYGKHAAYYEELAKSISGDTFKHVLQQCAKCLLGDDYLYPTQTAVCSFGFGAGPALDFKFELCAHCLFASDVEATSRLQSWFAAASLDPTDYFDLLDILSEGHLSNRAPELHCYVGVGLKQGETYATVYLKPRLLVTNAH